MAEFSQCFKERDLDQINTQGIFFNHHELSFQIFIERNKSKKAVFGMALPNYIQIRNKKEGGKTMVFKFWKALTQKSYLQTSSCPRSTPTGTFALDRAKGSLQTLSNSRLIRL